MVTITELPPRATSFEMPDAEQLPRLRSYVLAEHGWLRDTPGSEFHRAFWVSGTFFRVPQPVSSVYAVHWFDAANLRLERAGLAPIDGASFVCACLAHGDVSWRQRDMAIGQLLELGLGEFSGRSCNNVWRDILAGERGLIKPMPPDRGIERQDGIRVVRSAPAD